MPKPCERARRDALMAALGAAAGLLLPAQSAVAAEIGATPQWPRLRLLDGSVLEPDSWVGQPAVVVFWATWCPFCKRHNAHIDKLARSTANQRLRILGVALDKDEQAVRRYLTVNDYRFPVTLDGATLRTQLGLRSVIPMTCVFDRRGTLVQALPGEMLEEDVLDFAKLA